MTAFRWSASSPRPTGERTSLQPTTLHRLLPAGRWVGGVSRLAVATLRDPVQPKRVVVPARRLGLSPIYSAV
jgi:hypothetical protein